MLSIRSMGSDNRTTDVLALTPLLAGRSELGGRLGLVEATELLPGRTEPARLLSVRRDGAHLFLRYGLSSPA